MTDENFTPATEQEGSLFKLMPVTICIMVINVAIFVLMVVKGVDIMQPKGEDIYNWGGNMRMATLGGDWWRLFTCTFVHIGVIHLLCNMYGLFFIGSFLEPLLGKTKYIIAYLCTGILASVVSIWWSGERVSAGASGAIFGMYGVFLALLTTKLIHADVRKSLLQSSAVFVGYNLIYGMKGNVDNSAHIGGLVSGFVIGYMLYFSLKQTGKNAMVVIAMLVLTIGASGAYLITGKNDSVRFEQFMVQLIKIEEKAIEPRNNLAGKSDEEIVNILQNTCSVAWQEAKTEVDKTMQWKLPEELSKKRQYLKEYIDLRIRENQLMITSIKQGANADATEINEVRKSIDNISKQLGADNK
jgi:rhomboid protease GluP